MALTQISTEGIKNGTISTADLADESVTLAKLLHGTSSNDGKFLRANNGADPTFETVNTDLVSDTSPQLGGDLDTNDHHIVLDQSHYLYFITNGGSSFLGKTASGLFLQNNGDLFLRGDDVYISGDDASTLAKFIKGGAAELYHNNSKKFRTYSDGVIGDENIWVGTDNKKLLVGGSADLQIYHDGSNSYLTNTTGELRITDTSLIRVNTDDFRIYKGDGTELTFRAQGDGACTLFYDNSIKFETQSGGAKVSGLLTVDGNLISYSASNNSLGLSGHRWNDLFIANDIDISDNGKILLGDSDDLEIYHDGTYNRIESGATTLFIRSNLIELGDNSGNKYIKCIDGGATELYHNSSKKLETHTNGIEVTGKLETTDFISIAADDKKLKIGAGDDLQIYHDGTKSYIDNNTGDLEVHFPTRIELQGNNGSEVSARFITDGAVELFYDNSKKLDTASYGVIVRGQCYSTQTGSSYPAFQAGDDGRIGLGNSNDLQIYHDGTSNYISSQTGNLYIEAKSGETAIQIVPDGAVDLRYNGSKKVETTANGATIDGGSNISMDSNGNGQLKVNGNGYSGAIALNGTAMHIYHNSGVRDMIFGINESEVARFNTDGHFLPSANDTRDLGSTSKRWRNIYTNDLNLSNEGGANDVDGTWGSFTIQEGAEDLFLVNKRNGKKYKFNLTEVA